MTRQPSCRIPPCKDELPVMYYLAVFEIEKDSILILAREAYVW
jgi:hypothetical protein